MITTTQLVFCRTSELVRAAFPDRASEKVEMQVQEPKSESESEEVLVEQAPEPASWCTPVRGTPVRVEADKGREELVAGAGAGHRCIRG